MAVFEKGTRLNDEQLKEVKGGAILFIGRWDTPAWDIIDDQTGDVVGHVDGKDYMSSLSQAWRAARSCGVSTDQLTWKEVEQLRNNH